MMMPAIANVGLSVVWGKAFGLSGVAATIVGHLFIWYGRVKFVYVKILKIGMRKYWRNQAKAVVCLCIQIILIAFMTRNCGTGALACVIREGCVLLVTLGNILVVFGKR